MKIAILNAKYSPNLGDGAIAECMEAYLRRSIRGSRVFSLNIGGPDSYGGSNSMMPSEVSKIFVAIPDSLQRAFRYTLRPLLLRKAVFSKWKSMLRDCNALVIGGGHLFMDTQRYFPTRIALAVEAAPRGIPLFVYSVGVSKYFSSAGQGLFVKAFNHGSFISATVRDKQSLENWHGHFPDLPASITPDPALIACDAYGKQTRSGPPRTRPLIALGVSDPSDMRSHADDPRAVTASETAFFLRTIEMLVNDNLDVMLFTNGADQDYLDIIIRQLSTLKDSVRKHVTVQPRALKPAELIWQICQADALVAHRLHANILSFSYGIPSVGLMWDEKVASFFAKTQRESFLIRKSDPQLVLAKVKEALAVGVDKRVQQLVINESRAGLAELAAQLNEMNEALTAWPAA